MKTSDTRGRYMKLIQNHKKLIIIALVLLIILIIGGVAYRQSQKFESRQIPHKPCPHLLQSYWELVETEQNATDLLNNWIRSEYTEQEIGNIKIENVFKEKSAFYLTITTALPQKNNRIGFKYYKIENGQIFGLACGK